MIKLLHVAGCLFMTAFLSISQNFTPVTNDSTFYGSSMDSDFYGYIDIDNDQGVSQSMYWEVETVDLPSQWEFSVCDQDICYPIGTNGVEWSLPFLQGYLNMHFYPNNQEGEGFVTLRVYDYPNADQQELITFRGSALSQVGINEEIDAQIEVYPNPVTDKLKVTGNIDGLVFYISDIQGKIIEKGELSSDSELDFSNLNEGIYFLNVIGEEYTFTKKIVKN